MHPCAKLIAAGTMFSVLTACGVTGTAPNGIPTFDPQLHDDIDLWTVDVDAVRAMVPQGSAFNQSLRDGYIDVADLLGAPWRTPDRRHFLRKAVASAEGFNVQPDMLEYRGLGEASSGALGPARARLIAALDASGRQKAPVEAAKAQVGFDCWLMYDAHGNQEGIDRCRTNFEAALAEVESSLTSNVDNMYFVFFAWDQTDLTPVASTVLEQIAADFAEGQATRLVVAGHTDRSGSATYNLQLSEARARVVETALIALEVAQEVIELEWFGETMPLVPTEDGVREPENRRVEIVFQ